MREAGVRNPRYENVRHAERTVAERRDVIMAESVDGTRRAVIVEWKHLDTVGRPVVQTRRWAIATFDLIGPRRVMAMNGG